MFKPAYGASGVLAQDASSVTSILVVDPALYSELQGVIGLSGTEHTYLLIRDAGFTEVVKVTQLSNGQLIVVRGIDGTIPRAWDTGAPLEYVTTIAAISEIVQNAINAASLPGALTFTINDPHTVTQIADVVDIHIQKMPLTGDGTVSVMDSGDGYTIAVDRGAFGCCD